MKSLKIFFVVVSTLEDDAFNSSFYIRLRIHFLNRLFLPPATLLRLGSFSATGIFGRGLIIPVTCDIDSDAWQSIYDVIEFITELSECFYSVKFHHVNKEHGIHYMLRIFWIYSWNGINRSDISCLEYDVYKCGLGSIAH